MNADDRSDHAGDSAASDADQKPRQHYRRRRRSPAEPISRPSAAPQQAADNERPGMMTNGLNGSISLSKPRTLPVRRLRRRQFLAVDDADHPVDTGGNAAGEIAGLEFRRDVLVDDALGGDVGERAFEAVADLDAQAAVVLGDDEQRAVVDLLAADLPGLRDPDRELLDGLGVVVGTISTAIWLPLRVSEILQRLRQRGDVAAGRACRSDRPRAR